MKILIPAFIIINCNTCICIYFFKDIFYQKSRLRLKEIIKFIKFLIIEQV